MSDDLNSRQDLLAQRDVAEAEVARLQADNAALRDAARALTRTAARQVTGYDDAVVLILRMALNDLNRVLDQAHPGAALLAELHAARAVVEAAGKACEASLFDHRGPLVTAIARYHWTVQEAMKARNE